MASNSESYHEPIASLSAQTTDLHRALASLQEELEAVDWYQQRIDASGDADLKRILAHNRDEEKEHAAMVLEWIRRKDGKFDEVLRTYLFTSGDVTAVEEQEKQDGDRTAGTSATPTLTVGSLMGQQG